MLLFRLKTNNYSFTVSKNCCLPSHWRGRLPFHLLLISKQQNQKKISFVGIGVCHRSFVPIYYTNRIHLLLVYLVLPKTVQNVFVLFHRIISYRSSQTNQGWTQLVQAIKWWSISVHFHCHNVSVPSGFHVYVSDKFGFTDRLASLNETLQQLDGLLVRFIAKPPTDARFQSFSPLLHGAAYYCCWENAAGYQRSNSVSFI